MLNYLYVFERLQSAYKTRKHQIKKMQDKLRTINEKKPVMSAREQRPPTGNHQKIYNQLPVSHSDIEQTLNMIQHHYY